MGMSPLPVQHFYTGPPSPQPLVQEVLGGTCPYVTISKMEHSYLERVVTQLVRCSSLPAGENATRPPWWPADVVFRQPVHLVRDLVQDHATWPAILKNLIERCAQFYAHTRKFGALGVPRRVLALKQEGGAIAPCPTPNPVKGKRKRKQRQEDCAWRPKCPVKMTERMRPSSPRTLHKAFLHDKKLSSRAIVRLFDIHKEIPWIKQEAPSVTQDEFMRGFGLRSTSVTASATPLLPNTHNPIRLCTSHAIPFSSDYGRKLIERENYVIPSDMHMRKLEKLEWYLKGNESSEPVDRKYECTYQAKRTDASTYCFPRRQWRQKTGQSLKLALLKTISKPVQVKLERANLDVLLKKIKIKRSIRLSNRNICDISELELYSRCVQNCDAQQPLVVMRRIDAKPPIEQKVSSGCANRCMTMPLPDVD